MKPGTWIMNSRSDLTDRVKSPGLVWLGLHKKLPSWPFCDKSSSSALPPVMCAWNHLEIDMEIDMEHSHGIDGQI